MTQKNDAPSDDLACEEVLAEKDNWISQLESSLIFHQKQVAAFQQEKGQPDHAEWKELKSANQQLQQEIEKMKASYSWRIGNGLMRSLKWLWPFTS